MIISHTFEPNTPLKEKRKYMYKLASTHLGFNDMDLFVTSRLLFLSLINLRLKGSKCSIEFTEEYKKGL